MKKQYVKYFIDATKTSKNNNIHETEIVETDDVQKLPIGFTKGDLNYYIDFYERAIPFTLTNDSLDLRNRIGLWERLSEFSHKYMYFL